MSKHYPLDLYSALHTGNPGDIDFYLKACCGRGPVLELGCGAGRIGAALVDSGLEVHGVDIDPEAVTAARQFGLQAVHADMRDFRIRRRFQNIIIPYNGVYCLLSDESVVQCLRTARRHLAPGGKIMLDGYAADGIDELVADEVNVEDKQLVAEIQVGRRRYRVHERTRLDPTRQLVLAQYEYRPVTGGGPIRTSIRQRYLMSYQVPALLAEAGLMMTSLTGGYDDQPFTSDSEIMLIRAERW